MRRELFGLLALGILSGGSGVAAPSAAASRWTIDGIPPAPAALAARVRAGLAGRSATPLGWSTKGELLIATRFGETTQLHLVTAPGGERRQLTFGASPVRRARFSPDPWHDAFEFAAQDGGGGERLYVQEVGATTARALTDGKTRVGGAIWSNSGHALAFASAGGDARGNDIDVVAASAPAVARVVVAGNGSSWRPLDWSPDDRKLLVREAPARTPGALLVVDLAGGERRQLAVGAGSVGDARFSRDGQGVYLISDQGGEMAALRYVNLFTGRQSRLSDPGAGDVEEFALSRDGHYLAYTQNAGASDTLHLVDLRSGAPLPTPRLPGAGRIDALHFDLPGRRLAIRFSAYDRPADAYVIDLADSRVEQWTHSEAGPVDLSRFVAPQLTRFPSFDDEDGRPRELPVYVYEPRSAGRHPVLIIFHDGPDAAFRPGFDPWIQFVVDELGFAVVAPELRGSTGYGRSFASLDDGARRGDVLKDIGALLVWLEGRPDMDHEKVVVSGRSYGGYLALMALVNYSARLQGGVDLSGMTDLPTYLDALPPSLQAARRAEFGDESKPEVRAFLRNLSPLALADRITKPVLIAHGLDDRRVAAGQAEEMAALLRGHHVPVWLMLANGAGHRLDQQTDRVVFYTRFAQFLGTLR
ncbi:MAG: S9 family peptidase [Gammaproteobacteria bacterium]|nr:S9 family peptidase [Gammaproteobacteria bacterium]MDE2347296.1 S9 family peptidase [Gammaproteobacteria bacterium]